MEIELLAILSAIEHWHYYLVGREFIIRSDHQPLKAMHRFGKPNTRLFNWAMRLQQYNFKVEYRPGRNNEEADFLSRHPVEMLNDLTKHQINWIEIETLKNAQEQHRQLLPRKLRETIFDDTTLLTYERADQKKIFLPDSLAREEIQKVHIEKGHVGIKSIYHQFVCKYYPPKLEKIIKEVVDECEICKQAKRSYERFGTLGYIGPASEPFEIIHIDTKSGFSKYGSTKDNLHIAIDAFSRFVWYVAAKTKSATEYIQLLNKIMSINKPKLIVADNFSSFKGKVMRKFLRNNDINILFTSTDHASSNGLVERVNQTILERMRCQYLEHHDNYRRAWTSTLRQVVEDYNNSIHTSTEYTPIYLLTGIY